MSTLWVIGDSTVSSFEDKYYYPRYGYGTMLDKYLDDSIKVVNIALSGRSTKSYTTEPQYNELLSGMKQGDFLIIGFGHNDESHVLQMRMEIIRQKVHLHIHFMPIILQMQTKPDVRLFFVHLS